MAILGFNYDKLNVEKHEHDVKKGGEFKIKYNMAIKGMNDFDLRLPNKEKALKFNFEFSIAYDPKIGALNIGGNLIYSETEDKNKDVSNELKASLLNVIFKRSNIKALLLAQEVGLPSHIPMPKLVPPSEDPSNYIG